MNTYIRERRQECMAGTAVCKKIFDLKESSGDWVQMVLKLKFATSKRVQALGGGGWVGGRQGSAEYFKGIIWFSGERKKDQSPPTDCKRGIMEN